MSERTITSSFILLLALALFGAGYWLGQSPWAPVQLYGASAATPDQLTEEFAPFWEAWHLVQEEYYQQPVDDTTLVEGAIQGMLESLGDAHSAYHPPEEQASLEQQMSGEFEGIGAEVESIDGAITIVAPFEGSPAEEAGLQTGDILREADGVDLTDMALADAAALVRGPAGTTVHLVVEREGEQFEVDIVRGRIQLTSVRGEMLANDIAYVRLSRFGERTPQELEETLTDLIAEEPQGLILDLRQNPGGILGTATSVADQFLDEGPILIERFGDGEEIIYDADDEGLAQEVPMVVLIDEGSASASEVLAGALRDRERAVVIGQTSFGKGTVQTWQTLSNGGGIRLTIARWLTPDGAWVHEGGLVPDIVVPLPESVDEGELEDTQLEAAIEYLSERIGSSE